MVDDQTGLDLTGALRFAQPTVRGLICVCQLSKRLRCACLGFVRRGIIPLSRVVYPRNQPAGDFAGLLGRDRARLSNRVAAADPFAVSILDNVGESSRNAARPLP